MLGYLWQSDRKHNNYFLNKENKKNLRIKQKHCLLCKCSADYDFNSKYMYIAQHIFLVMCSLVHWVVLLPHWSLKVMKHCGKYVMVNCFLKITRVYEDHQGVLCWDVPFSPSASFQWMDVRNYQLGSILHLPSRVKWGLSQRTVKVFKHTLCSPKD